MAGLHVCFSVCEKLLCFGEVMPVVCTECVTVTSLKSCVQAYSSLNFAELMQELSVTL